MIQFDNDEKSEKELIEGWMENLHTYVLRLSEANNGFLSLPQNMVLKNRISSLNKDVQDILQDIKNLQ